VRKARRRERIRSFAPIAGRNARVLILGSMPGKKSLDARQYYAHKQNAFWRIVCDVLKVDLSSPYGERVRALRSARIAVWDVLHSCVRHGSLDTKIESDTEKANDFQLFFRAHGKITHVFFNGAKAEASFKRHVSMDVDAESLLFARLPSTSPAHASIPYARKLEAWRAILRG
jgi:TDG/mug DNA glycosylase family protein